MHKPRPNIWYVHPYAGGPGIGRYSRPYFLAKHWIAQGSRATVMTAAHHHLLDTPHSAGQVTVDGVPYEFLPVNPYQGNGLARIINMLALSRSLWAHGTRLADLYGRPDMIIASSPHPYHFLATHRLAKRFNALSIFEVRDLWPLSLIELAGWSAHHPLVLATAALEKYIYRNADCVVSLLPETLSHMTALGLEQTRWCYIPNGIDPSELVEQDTISPPLLALREWHGEARKVVLYAGALGEPNNVAALLEAAFLLKDCSVRFLIVGRGSQSDKLHTSVENMGLSQSVKIFPQVSKEAALSLMRTADIGFTALMRKDIFRFGISPNKLFDYMHAGLPIVCAIKAGNDPVSEANCGRTVDPDSPAAIAEAIGALTSLSAESLGEMGQNGKNYISRHHDYARLAGDYLRLYHSLR